MGTIRKGPQGPFRLSNVRVVLSSGYPSSGQLIAEPDVQAGVRVVDDDALDFRNRTVTTVSTLGTGALGLGTLELRERLATHDTVDSCNTTAHLIVPNYAVFVKFGAKLGIFCQITQNIGG